MNKKDQRELLELKCELQRINSRIDKILARNGELEIDSEQEQARPAYTPPEKITAVEEESKIEEPRKPVYAYTPPTPPAPKVKKERAPRDIEGKLGKNLMSILASLLIFIGIAMFAVLVYGNLTEPLKCALIYLFSFGVFGFGMWRMTRNPNIFAKAVTSCGIGAVFISILLTYALFSYISMELVFVLMIAWSLVVFLLHCIMKSDIFLIISYVGYTFAIFLGTTNVYVNPISPMTMFLILFGTYTHSLLGSKVKKSQTTEIILGILSLVATLILSISVTSQLYMQFSNFNTISELAYLPIPILLVGINLKNFKNIINRIEKPFLASIMIVGLLVANTSVILTHISDVEKPDGFDIKPAFEFILEDDTETEENEPDISAIDHNSTYGFSGYISFGITFSLIIHLLFTILFINKENIKKFFTWYLSVWIAILFMFMPYFEVITTTLGLLPLALLFLAGTYFTKDKIYDSISMVVFMLGLVAGCFHHSLSFTRMHPEIVYIFSIASFAYVAVMWVITKLNYDKSTKVKLYITSMLTAILTLNVVGDYWDNTLWNSIGDGAGHYAIHYLISSILIFIAVGAFTIFVDKSTFCCDWKYKRNDFMVIPSGEYKYIYDTPMLNVVNRAIMTLTSFYGITLAHEIDYNGILRLIVILLASILCFTGYTKLIKYPSKWIGYYAGLKATIFINLAINALAYEAMGFVYSIACLLISIASILIGFKAKVKSFRIYGLVLSIVSVLKLIMIDISYESSIARIMSFIISGILCFGIVWIYNKMSENIDNLTSASGSEELKENDESDKQDTNIKK